MNAKKMTLTLSTLLILAQPTHTGDALALAAAGTGCMLLGSIADGGKSRKLDQRIKAMSQEIDQIKAELSGWPAQGAQDAQAGIRQVIAGISKLLYGTQENEFGFNDQGLIGRVSSLETSMAQKRPGDAAVLPADLLQTVERGINQSQEQVAHFDEAVKALRTAVTGQMEAVQAQIEALKIAELRAQLGKELPQFRTDIDALGASINGERAARELLEQRVELLHKAHQTVAEERKTGGEALAARVTRLEGVDYDAVAGRLNALEKAPKPADLEKQVVALKDALEKDMGVFADRLTELEKSGALSEQRFTTHGQVSDNFAARLAALEGAVSKSTVPTGLPKPKALKKAKGSGADDDANPADGVNLGAADKPADNAGADAGKDA